MAETLDPRSHAFDLRAVNQAVIAEFRASGGRLRTILPGSRILLLTTTGARTGRPHTTPLGYVHADTVLADTAHADTAHADTVHADTAHPDAAHAGLPVEAVPGAGPDGPPAGAAAGRRPRRLAVYASNMAAPTHPQWYRNLVANPRVSVELGGERFDALASTATGAERDRLYEALVAAMPGLRSHREQTDREIPVVVLAAVS